MTEFETIETKTYEYGKNGFVEVSKKRAVDKEKTTEFISMSKGFYVEGGAKKYMKNITLPMNRELLTQLSGSLGWWGR